LCTKKWKSIGPELQKFKGCGKESLVKSCKCISNRQNRLSEYSKSQCRRYFEIKIKFFFWFDNRIDLWKMFRTWIFVNKLSSIPFGLVEQRSVALEPKRWRSRIHKNLRGFVLFFQKWDVSVGLLINIFFVPVVLLVFVPDYEFWNRACLNMKIDYCKTSKPVDWKHSFVEPCKCISKPQIRQKTVDTNFWICL
jgi:hypothetical protein